MHPKWGIRFVVSYRSFTDPNILEGPQYTNPQVYNGMEVPPILLSGHHKNIDRWKKDEAQKSTTLHRNDLK